MLYDPQTSGGLLIAAAPEDAEALLRDAARGRAERAALGVVEAYNGGPRDQSALIARRAATAGVDVLHGYSQSRARSGWSPAGTSRGNGAPQGRSAGRSASGCRTPAPCRNAASALSRPCRSTEMNAHAAAKLPRAAQADAGKRRDAVQKALAQRQLMPAQAARRLLLHKGPAQRADRRCQADSGVPDFQPVPADTAAAVSLVRGSCRSRPRLQAA